MTPRKKPEDLLLRGQPTKYKKDYCQLLIDHMSDGYSFESFAGRHDVRVAIDTLYNWANLFPDFSEAKRQACAARLKAHEERALQIARGGRGNATMQMFIMRTQHKSWQEKTQETQLQVTQSYEDYIKSLGENDNE